MPSLKPSSECSSPVPGACDGVDSWYVLGRNFDSCTVGWSMQMVYAQNNNLCKGFLTGVPTGNGTAWGTLLVLDLLLLCRAMKEESHRHGCHGVLHSATLVLVRAGV